MFEQFSSWLHQYASVITAVAQLLFVIVWFIYLHLFVQQIRFGNRFYIEIHHAQSNDLASACLLVNMGQQNANVRAIAVSLVGNGEDTTVPITNYRQLSAIDEDIPKVLRQGVLPPGELIVVGRFEDFLKLRNSPSNHTDGEESHHAADEIPHLPAGATITIQIRCVVLHGSTGKLMGAEREFTLSQDGDRSDIYPESLYTRQLVSKQQRQDLEQWYHGFR